MKEEGVALIPVGKTKGDFGFERCRARELFNFKEARPG
jgi:hypothetical protein